MYVTIDLLFLPYYQRKNSSVIVRQHDQGASTVYYQPTSYPAFSVDTPQHFLMLKQLAPILVNVYQRLLLQSHTLPQKN